ncbi:unnamed protein product [Blepharisma stoltei]|uniref:Secreted protein n=1 Tax=Blepharisma stoltei TaxID=1481888 RepID=A0AAU9K2S1_9CILI|nr:unnamed protein product [Blepharisma stoltei]
MPLIVVAAPSIISWYWSCFRLRLDMRTTISPKITAVAILPIIIKNEARQASPWVLGTASFPTRSQTAL